MHILLKIVTTILVLLPIVYSQDCNVNFCVQCSESKDHCLKCRENYFVEVQTGKDLLDFTKPNTCIEGCNPSTHATLEINSIKNKEGIDVMKNTSVCIIDGSCEFVLIGDNNLTCIEADNQECTMDLCNDCWSSAADSCLECEMDSNATTYVLASNWTNYRTTGGVGCDTTCDITKYGHLKANFVKKLPRGPTIEARICLQDGICPTKEEFCNVQSPDGLAEHQIDDCNMEECIPQLICGIEGCLICPQADTNKSCLSCESEKHWVGATSYSQYNLTGGNKCSSDCDLNNHAQVSGRYYIQSIDTLVHTNICLADGICPNTTLVPLACPDGATECEMTCVGKSDNGKSDSSHFPGWGIALIIILILGLVAGGAGYYLYLQRKRRERLDNQNPLIRYEA